MKCGFHKLNEDLVEYNAGTVAKILIYSINITYGKVYTKQIKAKYSKSNFWSEKS